MVNLERSRASLSGVFMRLSSSAINALHAYYGIDLKCATRFALGASRADDFRNERWNNNPPTEEGEEADHP
jgi:hypothetical protein